jgi:hypothetical protein
MHRIDPKACERCGIVDIRYLYIFLCSLQDVENRFGGQSNDLPGPAPVCNENLATESEAYLRVL